jgi:hypothetical protein
MLHGGPIGRTLGWGAQTVTGCPAMSDKHVLKTLPLGVKAAIEHLIADAAAGGGAVSPALIAKEALVNNRDAKVSRVLLAEAILRAAASRNLDVQVGRKP